MRNHIIQNQPPRIHILHTQEVGWMLSGYNKEGFVQAPKRFNYRIGDIIIVSHGQFYNTIQITSKEKVKNKFPTDKNVFSKKETISNIIIRRDENDYLSTYCHSKEEVRKYIRKTYQQAFLEIWDEKLVVGKDGFKYGFKDVHHWDLNPVDINQEIKIDLLQENSLEYEELLSKIDKDLHGSDDPLRFQDTLIFIRKMTENYSNKLGLDEYEILKSLEENRNYWSANYYQESKFPLLDDEVNIYEDIKSLRKLIDRSKGFRCGSCGEVSRGAGAEYECSECNYKTYGFLQVGKQYQVVIKDEFLNQPIVHKLLVPVCLEVE